MHKAAVAAPERLGNANDAGGYSVSLPGHEHPWIAEMLTIFGHFVADGQPSEATPHVTLASRRTPEEES